MIILRRVEIVITPPKIEDSIETSRLQQFGCTRVIRLARKGPQHVKRCARWLQADQLQPATQKQFVQPPSSNSTLWNWSESKTSGNIFWEEDSREAQPYWEQPPCHNHNPPHNISVSTPLDYWCGTDQSMGAVQDNVHGHGGRGIQRHPFKGQQENFRVHPSGFIWEDLPRRWKLRWSQYL